MAEVTKAPQALTQSPGANRTSRSEPHSLFAARHFAALSAVIMLLGACLRLLRFFADRSLWLDEVMLALNLDRTASEWTQGLDYHQAAPFGFLLLTKWIQSACSGLGLPVEYALRCLPLVASLGSLLLMRRVSRSLLSPSAALFALAILAIGEPSVRYAAEFKPYGVDAFVTLAILASVLSLKKVHGRGGSQLFGFVLIGSLACWLSYPSGFVLVSCCAWLLLDAARAERARIGERVLATSIIGLSGLSCVFLTLLPSLGDKILSDYWQFAFAPFPPKNFGDLSWYVRELVAMPRDALGFQLAGLGLLCLLLGALSLARKDVKLLALLLGPFALALLASGLGRYPWQGRMLLFAAPILAIFCGLGVDKLRQSLSPLTPFFAGPIVVGLLFMHPAIDGLRAALKPPPSQEMRQVLEAMREEIEPNDIVYLYYGGIPAWRFYAPRVGLEPRELHEGYGWDGGEVWGRRDHPDRWAAFERDMDALVGNARVWVVLSHIWRQDGVDEERLLRYFLDARGAQLMAIDEHESSAYLYDLRESARGRLQDRATSSLAVKHPKQ